MDGTGVGSSVNRKDTMSLIITATTGQLGRLIVESLLARGVPSGDIVATARKTDALDLGVPTAVLDYAQPETIAAVLKEGDTLVLVSANAPVGRVALHKNVIDAAKAAGVARILYTSAQAAATSTLMVAPDHKETEELIVASGIPFTILRNGWYTENYSSLVETARKDGTITASVGDGRVASASRKDYADAAAVALLDDSLAGQTLELSGDYAWNFDEFAAVLSGIVGKTVTYTRLTTEQHTEQLKSLGFDETMIAFVVGLDESIRNGFLGMTTGDLAKLIGRPTTPLAEGLAESVK
jgi:NAD(P)H dehydrogenase (quinone)